MADMNKTKTKILVVLGPTSSGKSDMAVELALKFGGEVVSADSRQVYRGLNIGTGKITAAEMKGVPHHCLDIADPKERFTAMDWKRAAEAAIADIVSRGKLPIICGGTGFYISSLVDDLGFPDVEADTEEQKKLEERSAEELFEELKRLDPVRAATIDLKNKRRLSRAILIARKLGSVPEIARPEPGAQKYDTLQIGIILSDQALRDHINARLHSRLDAGMIKEVERLHEAPPAGDSPKSCKAAGLSYERMDELGLEYRYIAQFLQMKLSQLDMIRLLSTHIWQYAKRQKTWFKKDARIRWFAPTARAEIEAAVSEFLK